MGVGSKTKATIVNSSIDRLSFDDYIKRAGTRVAV